MQKPADGWKGKLNQSLFLEFVSTKLGKLGCLQAVVMVVVYLPCKDSPYVRYRPVKLQAGNPNKPNHREGGERFLRLKTKIDKHAAEASGTAVPGRPVRR